MGKNVLERMKENDSEHKIAMFKVKQQQDYSFKKKYARIRAWEFYNHPEIDGMAYVAVGGLDSITLHVFLRSIGIDVPAISVSSLEDKSIQLVPYKYFHNLLEMPLNTLILLIGVIGVLFGIIQSILKPHWRKGIWFSGIGIVLAVIALFIVAGFNNTAFYPSYTDLNSSLTIYNASSSLYTLKTMAYVSLASPIVLAYIFYAWRALNKKQIDIQDVKDDHHAY